MKKLISAEIIFIVMIVLIPFLISGGCNKTSEDNIYIDITLDVYMHETGEIVQMQLEEYLLGVVAGEMPAGFEQEALNAQAVAARTYAVARIFGSYNPDDGYHNGAHVCTDPTHCQAWKSKEEMIDLWGKLSGGKYWKKIIAAVENTKGMVIKYNGQITNPVYHSNAGGKTECAEDVWGDAVPYLISVISEGDIYSPTYNNEVKFSVDQFNYIISSKKGLEDFKVSSKELNDLINIIEYTRGGGVKLLSIGDYEFSGIDMRKLFSLKSIKFEIVIDNENNIVFKTKGSGHGVGMSQWGANYLALNGGTYEEILKHYYVGINVENYR